MTWSFPIGRLFGSELRVHATFFLLLLWVGASAWAEGGAGQALFNLVFVLALFACVVAHEFGHALMARRFGIRTPDITLLPIGGVARLEKMPDNPVHEILVALAGPAVNVVIWAVLVGLFGAGGGIAQVDNLDNAAADFLGHLAAVNLLLVLFNLIPAFPMDGGRVLRAVLAMWLGRGRATAAAAGVGQALAIGLGLVGLLSGNLLMVLIAFFVFAAAQAENATEQFSGDTEGVPAREAMITSFESLGPDDGLMAMSAGLLRTTQHEFPVVDRAGRLLGFVTRDAIFEAASRTGQTLAGEVMVTEIPTVELTAPLSQVLDGLNAPGVPAVAVADRGGRFLGYVTRENIGEYMVLRRARRAV